MMRVLAIAEATADTPAAGQSAPGKPWAGPAVGRALLRL